MRVLLVLSFGIALLAWEKTPVFFQETNRDGSSHDEFYSGAVQEVSETTVAVARQLPGKQAETRVFVLDGDTIVEGRLKKQVRVTVGYRSHDGQDHAWRIIVRETPEP
ncbi:MAG: hypothetical protein K2X03_18355 [Bryobacteraceae bacterium]|nr:hypothetical protein [Bryobacteraceae bacterium]